MARSSTFTTYLNAKSDASLAREFNRLEAVGVSTYSTISRAADSAAKSTANLLGGGGGAAAAASGTTRALNDRATATRSIGTAAASIQPAVDRLAQSEQRGALAADRAANSHEALARSLQTTSKAFSVVQGPLGPVAGRLNAIADAVQHLTGFRLGLVGVAATLFTIGKLGVDYTEITTRLKPLYDGQAQYNTALGNVVRIAKDARQPLQAVADLYSRLTIAGKDIGLGSDRIARLAETASKAATLSGGSRETQANGLVQFSQAVGRGVLGGQDLRAIEEDIPVLSLAIAKGFKNVDGSIGTTVGHLRELGSEGKLTTQQIADALDRSAAQFIDGPFSKLPLTLSQATTDFKNSATLVAGGFDQAIGVTHGLASALELVGNNLNTVVAGVIGVGVAFAGLKSSSVVGSALDRLRGPANVDTGERPGVFESIQREQDLKRGTILIDRQMAIEQAQEAQAAVAATTAQIDGLRAEQAERTILIEQLRAQKIAEDQLVAAARASRFGEVALPGSNTATVTTGAAEERAQAATRALAQAETELAGVNAGLAASSRLVEVQHNAAAFATENLAITFRKAVPATGLVATGFTLVKEAGSSLLALLGGPWGIAIAAATAALYLLATAESSAEIAARKNADAQRDFEKSVDRATGKVYDQIKGLALLAHQKLQADATVATIGQAKQAGSEVLAAALQFTGQGPITQFVGNRRAPVQINRRTAAQQEVFDAAQAFQSGQAGSLPRLEAALQKNAGAIDGLRAALPGIGTKVQDFRALLHSGSNSQGQEVIGVAQAAARQRILAGKPRDGDTEIAFGSNDKALAPDGSRPKTTSLDRQADAAALARDADQVKARRGQEEQDLQALTKKYAEGGLSAEDYIKQRQEIKQTAATEIEGIQEATRERKKAASEGRAQAKKDARDAVQDQLDAAALARDNSLIALAKGPLNPKSAEYLEAREKILKTYDDEVNKINTSRAASHSAAEAILQDIEKQKKAAATAGTERASILGQYSDAPKRQVQAGQQEAKLQSYVGTLVDGIAFLDKTKAEIDEISQLNPLGTGLYTQEIADADKARIEDGLNKPLIEMLRSRTREVEVDKLILQGRQAEADALRDAFALSDQGVHVDQTKYALLVEQGREQAKINDLLNSRNRIVSLIQGTVDSTRDAFEQFLDDLPTKGLSAGTDLLKNLQSSFLKINNRALVERLFAGADDKVRALLEGRSETDTAIHNFAESINGNETSLQKLTNAYETAAQKFNDVSAGVVGSGGAAAGSTVGGANIDPLTGDIIVTARTASTPVPVVLAPSPSSARVLGSIFSTAFGNLGFSDPKTIAKLGDVVSASLLGSVLGSSFGKNGSAIGGGIGGLLQLVGNSTGAGRSIAGLASSLTAALPLLQIGAGLGNSIGGLVAGKGKDLSSVKAASQFGGILGGILGGLFAKTNRGNAVVTSGSTAPVIYGNDAATKANAGTLGGAVQDGLKQIASSLNVALGSFAVSIGYFGDSLRVDTSGYTGSLDSKHAPSLAPQTFSTPDEAVRYAIVDAIKDGAIKGISQASLNILENTANDLNTAVTKALTIEGIPKRLKAITDPVGAAVDALNAEFGTMISTLKEGGATAQQYADASKLYDLERAQAVKDALNNITGAIDSFIKDMLGSSSSPLNKKTVYDNASAQLNQFTADIGAGKVVDQTAFLAAAKNFEDASKALFGSSSSFFDDFNALQALLQKARDNASSDLGTLPASPFATDPAVAALVQTGTVGTDTTTSVTSAVQTQTVALGSKLDEIVAAIQAAVAAGVSPFSVFQTALGLLPGYRGALPATLPSTSVG